MVYTLIDFRDFSGIRVYTEKVAKVATFFSYGFSSLYKMLVGINLWHPSSINDYLYGSAIFNTFKNVENN